MLVSTVKKTGRHKRNIFFKSDVVGQVLDDPALFKAFGKAIDMRRKPPISQFVIATLTGVTYTAMDKMRFATAWCPDLDDGELEALEREAAAAVAAARPMDAHDAAEDAAEDRQKQGLALLRLEFPRPNCLWTKCSWPKRSEGPRACARTCSTSSR